MSPSLARALNAVGLVAISGILIVAFGYQLGRGELPCPLCLLQRMAFVAAGVGVALNVCAGSRPAHYAMIIISAAAGALIAGRQVLLHIVPGSGGYGSPLWGMHFYTWAAIAFAVMIVAAAAMLMAEPEAEPAAPATARPTAGADPTDSAGPTTWSALTARSMPAVGEPTALGRAAVLLFLAVALANAASTFAECGLGLCPDNPTSYQLFG